ncbi:MAG TPA: metal-dependent hydrolase [Candidatus Limnocylindrales bacterium]|nr:metal-dependent hydrolase [Candidatus Limnocylindrales bacterium]
MALDRETDFTWFGHAALRIGTPGGKAILVDPWLGNPNSPITVDEIDRCDLLLLTHGHFDHMGNGASDVLAIASRLQPTWPMIHEASLWFGRRLPGGMDAVIGMNAGGTVEVGGIRVTMTPAVHSAGDWNPAGETTLYLGDPVGFLIELENGFRIYESGDTDVFGDMALIRELYRPELAILPIGGHYTMGPRGAAKAVELLGVKHVIPVHYGTFPVLTGRPEELRVELDARGLRDVEIHAVEPGGTIR